MLGGADNPNGELPSYITGADRNSQSHNLLLFMTGSTPLNQPPGYMGGF